MQIVRVTFLAILCGGVLSVGCLDLYKNHRGKEYWPEFELHEGCTPDRVTADGNLMCSHVRESVTKGFLTEADIERCVDASVREFWRVFPEFYGVRVPIVIHDHYAFRVPGSIPTTGVSGWHPAGADKVCVSLWTRKESKVAPEGVYWKENPPGEIYGFVYSDWRFTDWPILPSFLHEMLHRCIPGGDAKHKDLRWKLVPGVCDGCVNSIS